jgi:hypothetical protein
MRSESGGTALTLHQNTPARTLLRSAPGWHANEAPRQSTRHDLALGGVTFLYPSCRTASVPRWLAGSTPPS